MFALIASGGGDRCPTSTGGATQVQPCFGDLDDSWEVVSHQFDRVTMFTHSSHFVAFSIADLSSRREFVKLVQKAELCLQ